MVEAKHKHVRGMVTTNYKYNNKELTAQKELQIPVNVCNPQKYKWFSEMRCIADSISGKKPSK